MRSTKLLSALLLVGALTLAAPGIASAHAEGRANCRYATQQTGVFNLALLGHVRQTLSGVFTGVVASIEELDRSLERVTEAVMATVGTVAHGAAATAGEAIRTARTTVGLAPWAGAQIHAPR